MEVERKVAMLASRGLLMLVTFDSYQVSKMEESGAFRPDLKCPGYEATLAQASLQAPLMGRCAVARRLIAE